MSDSYDFEVIRDAIQEWFCMDIDDEKWDYFKELLDAGNKK